MIKNENEDYKKKPKILKSHKLFAIEYCKNGMNALEAYKKVYNTKNNKKQNTKSCKSSASRLLTNVNLQLYIQELQEEIKNNGLVEVNEIIKELKAIAFFDRTEITNFKNIEKLNDKNEIVYEEKVVFKDTDDLDPEAKKIISGYKKTNNGFAVETYDKLKALELLGKYLGMFKEKVEQSGETTLTIKMDKETEELAK